MKKSLTTIVLSIAACVAQAGTPITSTQKADTSKVRGEVAVTVGVAKSAAAKVTPLAVVPPAGSVAAVASAPSVGEAVKPSVAPAKAIPAYKVRGGEMLSQALNRWVGADGYTVVWRSDNDYQIAADAVFTGGLMQALESVANIVAVSNPAIRIRLYANGVILVSETSK